MGDGTGGTEVKISKTLTGRNCVRECRLRKRTDNSINGVTVFKDGSGGCWCEKNMKSVKKTTPTDKKYKTCLLKQGGNRIHQKVFI